MTAFPAPFAVPDTLEPPLTRCLAYWRGLLRAENDIPFADDLQPPVLQDLADDLMLVEVFSGPERFRLNMVGAAVERRCGTHLSGLFADEIGHPGPLRYLRSQCSAAVEGRQPTYYRQQHHAGAAGAIPFARLLLPTWGDGRVSLLLGAFAWH